MMPVALLGRGLSGISISQIILRWGIHTAVSVTSRKFIFLFLFRHAFCTVPAAALV